MCVCVFKAVGSQDETGSTWQRTDVPLWTRPQQQNHMDRLLSVLREEDWTEETWEMIMTDMFLQLFTAPHGVWSTR